MLKKYINADYNSKKITERSESSSRVGSTRKAWPNDLKLRMPDSLQSATWIEVNAPEIQLEIQIEFLLQVLI